MKITIDLPENYYRAYKEMLELMEDNTTVEEAIAQDAINYIHSILFDSPEWLGPTEPSLDTSHEEHEKRQKRADEIISKYGIRRAGMVTQR